MNARSFKVIFSKRLGALVAVGENATSQGKSASGEATHIASGLAGAASSAAQHVGVLKHICLAALLGSSTQAFALDANALPTGAELRHGAATVGTEGATMTINQSTSRATINWQSFNVGTDARVNVVQNNSQSVLLNRVVGNEMSQIRGQISANGQVVLVNPNGIVMGPTGRITASAFTASTFGITDANFKAGHMKYERNGSTGQIVHQGHIQTAEAGGYVALIGADVNNQGTITTRQGAVVLAAADAVTLPSVSEINNVSVPLSRNVRLEINPAAFGSASVSNSGVIQTEGGQVLLRAAAVVDAISLVAQAKVTHNGTIDTTGSQGGGVDILADKGHVRVSGTVKANSSNSAAGGDIYIGRDKDTNVLAAVGDASGARLESKGGFVETSGIFLNVDGIRVMAKDWLLDPVNIDITGDAVAATTGYSKIKASDIATALNDGTSVTVATTATNQFNQPAYKDTAGTGAGSAVTGDGNILVNAAIVKSGAKNASLTLKADNGITVNQRIGKASGDITSTGKLNVVMTANGDAANTSNSKGITLNNVIDAHGGTVTLTGTSKDTSGVQTGPTYTWGVTNNSRSGVVFNNGSGITADNYQVNGTHTVAAGNSFGVNGVYMNGTVTFKVTGNTDSVITGNSNAQGNFGAGVMVMDGAKVTIENQGTGVTTLKGSNTNTGGGNGVRIGASTNTAVINAVGRVTIGQQTAGVNAPTFFRGTINASQNSANLSGLSILGQTGLNSSAVQIWDTTINATGIDVVVDGITANAAGVYIQKAVNTTWTTKNLTVTGVANTTSGSSGTGVVVQRYREVLTVNASGNIDIEGTVQGAGTGRGLYFAESGWGAQAPRLIANGNITLRGNNRALASSANEAINITAGVQAIAGGNIVLQGETNKAAANAIHLYSAATGYTAWNTVGASALQGNTTLQATGNVLIQSNQGGILLNNQLSSTLNNGGTPLLTSDTKITGKNITFDNTGAGMTTGASNTVGWGRIDATTGAITAGTGKATGTHGINFGDNRDIKATGNLNIMGASSAGDGVRSIAKMEAGESLSIAGQSETAGSRAVVITNSGTLNGTLKVADGKTINIHANTLTLEGAATAVDAGTTGTVNIKTRTSGNEIVIGAADTLGTTLASQKLGIVQNELNRINAGKLVIGDTTSTGNITVSGDATTLAKTGDVTLQTGGAIAVNQALTVGDAADTKNLTLDAGGAITNGANGKLTATNLTLEAGTTIGTADAAIKTAVVSASLTSDGNQFLVEDDAVTISSATTTGTGNIDIKTVAGTLTVGPSAANLTVDSKGAVRLEGNAPLGHGLALRGKVNAKENIFLIGTTRDGVTSDMAGILSTSEVNGKRIEVNGTANSTNTSTGKTLGFYGADTSKLIASENLKLTGSSNNTGNGFYAFGGQFQAGTGIEITSTSADGQGVGFDANAKLINTTGDILIKGTASDLNAANNGPIASNTQGIGLRGVSIENAGGKITLEAVKGQIFADTGNPAWGVGSPLANTITQNGTGDVKLTTVGNGHIHVPLIVNNGAGNVIVAAGSDLGQNIGNGGQVKTALNNRISQNNGGTTFIYSGKAAETGALGILDNTLVALKIDGTATQNADTNVAYNASSLGIAGSTAPAQVLFREALAVDSTVLAATTLVKTYGDSTTAAAEVTTLLAEAKAALKNNAANSGDNSTFTTGAANSNNRIVVSKSVVVDSLTGPSALTNGTNSLATSDFSSAGVLKAKQGAYKFAGFASNKYNVTGVDVGVDVAKRNITIAATPTTLTFNGAAQTQAARTQTGEFLVGDKVEVTGGSATGTALGTYNDEISWRAAVADDLSNYNVTRQNAALTIVADTPPIPPGPVVPVPAPAPSNNTVVVAGGNNSFQLAGAEAACSADTLNQCECETATNPEGIALEGIQICYEPNSRPSSAL